MTFFKNIIRVLSPVLLFILLVPSSAAANDEPFPAGHWSYPYYVSLAMKYNVEDLMTGCQPDSIIDVGTLQKLLAGTLAEGETVIVEGNSRQEVASVLTDLVARKAGLDLDACPTAVLLSFQDYGEIDPALVRNVMFAIDNGILRGKSQSYLEPADPVTVGETLVMIDRADAVITKYACTLSGEIIRENQNLRLIWTLTNHSPGTLSLTFSSGQLFEMIVVDNTGKEYYRYSVQHVFTQGINRRTLQGGQTLTTVVPLDAAVLPVKAEPGREYYAIFSLLPVYGEQDDEFLKSVVAFMP